MDGGAGCIQHPEDRRRGEWLSGNAASAASLLIRAHPVERELRLIRWTYYGVGHADRRMCFSPRGNLGATVPRLSS